MFLNQNLEFYRHYRKDVLNLHKSTLNFTKTDVTTARYYYVLRDTSCYQLR